MISSIATAFVSAVTMSASLRGGRAERGDEVARRDAQEDRRDRQQQEQQGDARREDERRPEDPVYDGALGSGEEAGVLQAACPLTERIRLIQARAATLLPDRATTAIS